MRRKGFTLVELLVVIAIIALLMGILMPALARVRQLAFRMTCGTNLAGIGKAMLIYANDYEDEFPRAGGRTTVWGSMPPAGWTAANRTTAYGMAADASGGTASISSCFYLLVKYTEVTPKSFICKGDQGATEFMLSNAQGVPPGRELIDLWDFGPPSEALKHCSYSYHIPFGQYALTTSNEPGMAMAADRNPWIDSPSEPAQDFSRFRPDVSPLNGSSGQARRGNTMVHQQDGQNVLFLDSHVEFAKRAFCGVDHDNIYTVSGSSTGGDPLGAPPTLTSRPANRKDSLLVNDSPTWNR
jgi:prepilin-type N-terminal cleavage/methylation domain-containing protein